MKDNRFPLLLVVIAVFASAGAVRAENAEHPIQPLKGLIFYGTFDVGYSHQSHGLGFNDNYPSGAAYFPLKASTGAKSQLSGNGLSQSVLGLRGERQFASEWSGLFRLETVLDPIKGRIANGQKSLIDNNGLPITAQSASSDSSLDGQIFNSTAWVGIKSDTAGRLTVGRNFGVLKDAVVKYDPLAGSYAFSAVGGSNTAAGGGSGEYTRLNHSLRYTNTFGSVQVDGLYAKGGGDAWQLGLGTSSQGISVDAVYANKKQSVSASALGYASSSGATSIQRITGSTSPSVWSTLLGKGYSYDTSVPVGQALVATVADTAAWGLFGKVDLERTHLFIAYERINYSNPSEPYAAGSKSLGGYQFAIVNNNAYATDKVLQIGWAGVKYALTPQLDITGAIYRYQQNSYTGNACTAPAAVSAGTSVAVNTDNPCSAGAQYSYSLVGDYRYNSWLDFYVGIMTSHLRGGLASGFAQSSVYNAMAGVRLQF